MTTTLEPSEAVEAVEDVTVEPVDTWYMAGTEGTGQYKVLATSSFGRIGYRVLKNQEIRIRVEPTDENRAKIAESLTIDDGWRQPGDNDQDRFSIVVSKGDEATAALKKAYGLIKRGRPIQYNPNPPQYAADLAAIRP